MNSIRDEDYRPGPLHRILLSLPWSDVFTTNYDTLLERARTSVHERNYELIQTVQDIPHRMKPRIVKLHGSFPSHRPFIITEEDYRTYPTRFAPFVNMVQQSIMENSLCLVGFSGDDPNFLYWSGWVRDNLGDATPPIYLCGILNLSDAQRRLLENRNIIPIDLSTMFPESDWPSPDVRHSKATEWFLLNLLNGAPPDKKKWPGAGMQPSEQPTAGLPQVPPGPAASPDQGQFGPRARPVPVEDLLSLRKEWTATRLAYPGWVVPPKENRKDLWLHTQFWSDEVLSQIESLDPPEDLFLVAELNWRLERALCPLFLNQVEKIAAVVEKYNPFPALVDIDATVLRPDAPSQERLDWAAIGDDWVSLTFALAREARDDHDEQRFLKWMERVRGPASQRSDWQARLSYEECLFHLFRLDEKSVRSALATWPSTPNLPFWNVRRASLLAELGDLLDATKLAEEALAEIRSRIQPYSPDYALLSQEGWTMSFLRALRMQEDPTLPVYQQRWDRLEEFRCNPWRDIDFMQLKLHGTRPGTTPEKQLVTEFDPGRTTVTHHLGGNTLDNYLPAFAFLRLFEEAGIPMRCGNVNMFSKEVAIAAQWIMPFAPFWALCAVIRSDNSKALKTEMSRAAVAVMKPETVDALYCLAMGALKQTVEKVNAGDEPRPDQSCYRLISILSELLSRIAFRLDNEALSSVYDLAVELYGLPLIRRTFTFHSCLSELLRRVVFALGSEGVIQRMPELLALPIPGIAGFDVGGPMSEQWPEPFDYISRDTPVSCSTEAGQESWETPIRNLLSIIHTGDPDARKRASCRLVTLHDMQALTQAQEVALGEALWSRLDPDTALPADTQFYSFAFLRLPEPEEGTTKKILRKLLLARDFQRTVTTTEDEHGKDKKSAQMRGGHNVHVRELLGASVRPLHRSEDDGDYID
ncbi:MAG: SIR2 family protein, partial [Lentisphaerae bacterium]|nr:SIR2 family protein [Lentisphaerota bacterium]